MTIDTAQLDQLERILTFNRVALRIQEEKNVQNIYSLIGEGLKEIGLYCSIMLLDEEQKNLKVEYSSAMPSIVSKWEKLSGFKDGIFKIPADSPVSAITSIRERRAIHTTKAADMMKDMVPSLRHVPMIGQAAKLLGVGHAISAPLIARGEVFGSLSVWSGSIPEEDIPIVVAFTNQAAVAIDNAVRLPSEFEARAKELREAEEKYRQLLEDMRDGYIVVKNAKIVFANESFCEIYGYEAGQATGQNITDFIAPEDLQKVMEIYMKVVSGEEKEPEQLEFTGIKRDGTTFPIQTGTKSIQYENEPAFSVVIRDITERKKVEDELRESYDIFSSIIDTANEIHLGIEIIQNVDNKEGVIVFANEEVARNTGYSHEELIGMTIHQMLPPEELAKLTERYAKRQAGEEEPTYYEFLAQRKDGTMFPVEIGIGLTTYHGKIASIAFMQDITQRKQAEEQLKEYSENLEQMVEERTRQLEDANKALVRTEKLATIGQLSGSIGHELRNPLGVIKNSAYFLKMKLGHLEDEKVARHLDILDSQIDACNSIISDLLDFSRPGKLEMNEIYIDQVVLEVVQNTTVPQSVEMSTSMAGALAPVMADKGLLERIVSNLVNNSIQAMPDGGKLSLSVNQNNGFVEASVIDTGTGIPEENLDMIFEPLFTTKAKGVGLGLSLTKALVERQNGTISVQSQVGEGTTFTIKFPIAGDNQSVSNT